MKPRKKFERPERGVTVLTTCVTGARGVVDGGREGGGACSEYIFRMILSKDDRCDELVSKAKRTRITSRGYVRKTLIIPAALPERKRRMGVSCAGVFITRARICSYARNFMPA